ncbi:MAG: hypothetical protein N4A50_05040 [Vallitalea sp.]|jgi:hypothetical protein|nr:hypothetical protein [Vallitalea sp.]
MRINNVSSNEYGMEGTTRFDMFDREIQVMMDDAVNIVYAEKCVEHLNSLSYDTVELLCEAALKYCFEFSDDVGIGIPELNEKRDILKYIYPKILIIDEPEDELKIGYHMECDCEWEIEHGLEFTILNDKVLYLGDFNDEGPWQALEHYKEISWNHIYDNYDIFDEELRNKLFNLLQ